MKKVALMTWFQHDNYGTVLQSVATTRVIKNMGHCLEGIDYISEGYDRTTKLEKLLTPSIVKEKMKRSFKYKKYHKEVYTEDRAQAFKRFKEKHLSMRKAQTSSELYRLNKEYDAFICGSDQIWSPREFNSKYYLDFVEVENKMIAYAPSFGRSVIKKEFAKKRIAENLKRFKHLSIREKQGADLIKELTDLEARVVLDPTLLLTAEEWDDYLISVDTPSAYILCYFLGDNEEYWKHVKKLSEQYGLKVIIIPIFKKDFYRGYITLDGIGPGEFLYLVKKASFVCTDSFHGTIFSLLYKRPFLTYKRFSDKNVESQNSRIYNLLNLINLQDRLVSNNRFNIDNIYKCDFEKTFNLISVEKHKSMLYLEDSLNDAFKYTFKNNYKITNTCSGCSVCVNVCKHKAISIEINNQGFYEAIIDKENCTGCGLCKKVCPYNGGKGENIDKENAILYMLRSTTKTTLATSTSGGASYEISKLLSNQGYDIVGCTYDKESSTAIHKKAKSGDISSLSMFQGSKYIQSNTKEAFKDVLLSKNAVVFGTPCQIAGLDNLLKIKGRREDFVLVDLICHGVPSNYLWYKYLNEGSKKYGYGREPEVQFRFKKKGWKKIHIYVSGNNNTYIRRNTKDMFYKYFELQNCYMPSCYECNYRITSKADIRIGDYWGEKYDKYKITGASMVISMTSSGKSVLEKLQEKNMVELIKEDILDYWNVQFPVNPIKPLYYDELISELKSSDLDLKSILNKYSKIEYLNKVLSTNYAKIKRIVK